MAILGCVPAGLGMLDRGACRLAADVLRQQAVPSCPGHAPPQVRSFRDARTVGAGTPWLTPRTGVACTPSLAVLVSDPAVTVDAKVVVALLHAAVQVQTSLAPPPWILASVHACMLTTTSAWICTAPALARHGPRRRRGVPHARGRRDHCHHRPGVARLRHRAGRPRGVAAVGGQDGRPAGHPGHGRTGGPFGRVNNRAECAKIVKKEKKYMRTRLHCTPEISCGAIRLRGLASAGPGAGTAAVVGLGFWSAATAAAVDAGIGAGAAAGAGVDVSSAGAIAESTATGPELGGLAASGGRGSPSSVGSKRTNEQ